MKLDPSSVQKPLRKLRKQLNALRPNPRPEDVHSLRTQTRKLEATVAALVLDREKESRRLIKLITPVRKAAGKVRDMDVLVGDALTLSGDHPGEGLVRLVEHLSKMRVKSARKLHDIVRRRRQQAGERLKQTSKLIKRKLKDDSSEVNGEAAPQILITELRHWPALDANNLHEFRIRIKELRYMLQLGDEADGELVDRLGDVKDAIGEWHDWVELLKIARKVLYPHADLGVLQQIEKIGQEKFRVALTAANQLRERHLEVRQGRKGGRKVLQMASGF